MPKIRKYIAALTAALLLCGCTNNDTSSAPESVSSSEATSATSENSPEITTSAPEQNTTPEGGAAPADPGVMDTSSVNSGGVDLVSGNYSDNNNIFDLNGKYCDISELPFSVETFQPELVPENSVCINVCNGKLILIHYKPIHYKPTEDIWQVDQSTWELYTYDLKSKELTEIYSSNEWKMTAPNSTNMQYYSGNNALLYADDTYVFIISTDEYGAERYTVINHTTGKIVLDLPKTSENGNSTYFANYFVTIVYDYLYFDGYYNIAEYDKAIPVIFKANLQNGEIELFRTGACYPFYGVANVCFKLVLDSNQYYIDDNYANLRGDIFQTSDTGNNTQTSIADTYYPIVSQSLSDDILGSREKLSWIDKNNISHEIGTTGFNYYVVDKHITKDGIFLFTLCRNENQPRLLIGCYDEKSGINYAALVETNRDERVFMENTAIYLVKDNTLETTVLSPYKDEFIYMSHQ